ncbi:hypothetical protein EDD21DRAFT_239194 [Dissophora ornata]|nr:hypothetical protein BGZ58_001103 [Dissophora ornata]KAI8596707.1 hypothetical protein EDD21DRAFT_239194 [Dissophora ornata]
MAKRDSEKHAQRPSRALEDTAAEEYADSSSNLPVSDTSSQFSKDSPSERKKRAWTKSLKKATSSIIYMAMPPTNSDHVPMVVAQTPMSPDHLVPKLRPSILQYPLLTDTLSGATKSNHFVPVSESIAASTYSAASSSTASTSSFKLHAIAEANAGWAGPSTSAQLSPSHRKHQSASPDTSSSSTVIKRSLKGKERAEPILADLSSDDIIYETRSRSIPFTSPPSSPPDQLPVKSPNGTHADAAFTRPLPSPPQSPTTVIESQSNVDSRTLKRKPVVHLVADSVNIGSQQSIGISPEDPFKQAAEESTEEQQSTGISSELLFKLAAEEHTEEQQSTGISEAPVEYTAEEPVVENDLYITQELLPMIPPNLSRFSRFSFALDAGPEEFAAAAAMSRATQASSAMPIVSAAPVDSSTHVVSATTVVSSTPDIASTVVSSTPDIASTPVVSAEEPMPEHIKETPAKPAIKTREDIVFEPFEDAEIENEQREPEEEPQPDQEFVTPMSLPGAFPVYNAKKKSQPIKKAVTATSLPGAFPIKSPEVEPEVVQETSVVTSVQESVPIEPEVAVEVIPRKPKVQITQQTAPSERKQRVRSMVVDPSGFPIIPTQSMLASRDTSGNLRNHQPQPQPRKNVPWLWHQDGIHHQRLESHQILTKEQVFEQFHLDLEQDGPNGFFLFKLVKRFKKQESSLLAISSSLLGAELSASPSSSPLSSSPTSLLESLESVSVSQKLKRQLLLQKHKKQRKSSGDNEESENLEALLAMANNNTSLPNLNSSLQEVIDAVDSLKDSDEWTSLLSQPRQMTHSQSQSKKPSHPDSESEYTSRDKDAMDLGLIEKRRGVYATGRLDGTHLVSKKRYRTNQRRQSTNAPRKGSVASSHSAGNNGTEHGPQDETKNERRGSEATEGPSALHFKKQAVSQLHIYSRNGLKFKFDVMGDNELHFVEASKKYTFMDPLAPHRQPDLDAKGSDTISPLRSTTLPHPPNGRRTNSGTVSTTSGSDRPTRRSGSSASKSTASSSGSTGGRRVFVTRLGRHTLLTYPEYKVLAKSASSFTLGAKLLLQRSIAVATPSFYNSSQSAGGNGGHGKDASQATGHDVQTASSSKSSVTSPVNPTPTPTGNADSSDYFSTKKKSRTIPGFASKAVAAIKSPSTPTGTAQPKTPRPVVTPYNPRDYLPKSLTVSTGVPNATAAASEESLSLSIASSTLLNTPLTDRNVFGHPSSSSVDVTRPESPSIFPLPPNHVHSPPEPFSLPPPTPNIASPTAVPTAPPISLPSSSSSSLNPYASIKRHGNQAGLKFQHLFVTVHQRLQKLELDNGASFYGSALVQWTVIEDPAELRWWRDKIGLQMIGRLEGDEVVSVAAKSAMNKISQHPLQSAFSSAISVRSSYVSAFSTFSDAASSSSSSLSSQGSYNSQISVERLGYRFLRVSGLMGTLKVTVTEEVEARAVALAVRSEMLRQKRLAQQQRGQIGRAEEEEETQEQSWVELTESPVESDDDDSHDSDDSNDDNDYLVGKNGEPKRTAAPHFYDLYEYDEWTGRTRLKKGPTADRFSRRKRHDRAAKKQKEPKPLIERMTMIVGQTKAFNGNWYMKNVYKFHP